MKIYDRNQRKYVGVERFDQHESLFKFHFDSARFVAVPVVASVFLARLKDTSLVGVGVAICFAFFHFTTYTMPVTTRSTDNSVVQVEFERRRTTDEILSARKSKVVPGSHTITAEGSWRGDIRSGTFESPVAYVDSRDGRERLLEPADPLLQW